MYATTVENIYIRERIISKFWPLASLVLIVFIFDSFFISNDYLTGWLHLVNLVLLSVSLSVCLNRKKILLACNILSGIGMITILSFLFTGGPANAGFWWSIVYVIGVFLVTTKKWAIFWLSLYILLTFIVVLLSLNKIVTILYSVEELVHLLFVFMATFAFVYYFNQVNEKYLRLANERAEELSHLNKDLISLNKELEEFAYVASHDLQEPLQTIQNFTGLLDKQYRGKLGEDTDQYFQFIINASSKMKTLIKELLDLSRVGRNLAVTIVDCNKVLNEVLSDMKLSIDQSGAKIVSSTLPKISGSETELKQLFQNLISNALKFAKKNSTPHLEITFEEKEDNYLFSFKDNGIGVDEKYKNRIFIIFQRLHTADEYPGIGIGLAVCKKIIDAHRGKIWLESVPDSGCNFYFTLPKLNLVNNGN
ncbi:sensor histidine kinase [Aurantibacillus circumpalustris]|uniref:sensor histidine kinase n=1 Tax=Aurantibacillus circumpalustris TaxID=3036359 RepID=UPI00295A8040|nr:ATP-binding protein [Aurantibacillus circumpalustris]